MYFTPNELQNVTFKKSLFGYNEEQVNDVIDKVIEDYSAYIHENIEYKDKASNLIENMQHYKKIEESLQNTLLLAQQTSEDIKKNAYQKAENMLREAELKSQKMIDDATAEVTKIKYEYDDMRKKMYVFKSKSETLLNSQLEILKMVYEENS